MCLRSKDRVPVDGVGYKIFTRLKDGKLRSYYIHTHVYEGRWQTAPKGEKIFYGASSHSYPPGFHVLLIRPDTTYGDWTELWRVEYQGVITSGIDNDQHTVVAKRMKLIEQVDVEGRRVTVKKG